jgi:selenocysteine lyase/cysteine desulfurase
MGLGNPKGQTLSSDPFALLDALIDDYLRHERNHRPRLSYPGTASGMGSAGSNRSFQSADELLDDSVHSLRMAGMSGAWASLSVRQEQALRIDASNRRGGVTVFRVANLTPTETAGEVRAAKVVLRALLVQRNVLC